MATKVKTVKLKRLWNNIASTRDYIVDECLHKQMTLRFECGDQYMEIPWTDLLKRQFKTNPIKQSSRYGKDYYLVDFVWNPQKPNIFHQQELFI